MNWKSVTAIWLLSACLLLAQVQLKGTFQLQGEFTTAPTPTNVYYVFVDEATGNNTNAGTSNAPLQSFTYGFTNIQAHSYPIFVGTNGEVYTETNCILSTSGAQGAPICITCWSNGIIGAGTFTLSNYWTNFQGAVLTISNASWVNITNVIFSGNQTWLTLSGGTYIGTLKENCGLHLMNSNNTVMLHDINYYGCGFQFLDFADYADTWGLTNNTISNINGIACWANSNFDGFGTGVARGPFGGVYGSPVFHNINYTLCQASNCPGNTNVAGYAGFGFLMQFCQNGTCAFCTAHTGGITNNSTISGGGAGFISDFATGCVYYGCEVWDWHACGSNVDGIGIDLSDTFSWGNTAEYCYAHNNQGAGVYIYSSPGGNVTRFCVCASNGLKNEAEYEINASGSTNNLLLNCTLMALAGDNAISIPLALASSNNFANNVLYSSSASLITTADTTHVTFATNDYTTSFTNAVNWNGTLYATISAWKSGASQDTGGTTNNPTLANAYVSPTNGTAGHLTTMTNWTPNTNSLIIGQGMDVNHFWGLANGGLDFLSNSIGNTNINIGAVAATNAIP